MKCDRAIKKTDGQGPLWLPFSPLSTSGPIPATKACPRADPAGRRALTCGVVLCQGAIAYAYVGARTRTGVNCAHYSRIVHARSLSTSWVATRLGLPTVTSRCTLKQRSLSRVHVRGQEVRDKGGGGGGMMDGREEDGGRNTHSSVGGIYRLNRTAST